MVSRGWRLSVRAPERAAPVRADAEAAAGRDGAGRLAAPRNFCRESPITKEHMPSDYDRQRPDAARGEHSDEGEAASSGDLRLRMARHRRLLQRRAAANAAGAPDRGAE